MYNNSIKDIVRILNQNIDGVVRYLLPNGKRKNNEWCVGSIFGEPGDSLKICLSGGKLGIWCDFASGQHKGDLLDLWCTCRNVSIYDAVLEAKQWLGLPQMDFEPKSNVKFTKPNVDALRELPLGSVAAQYLINDRKLDVDTLNAFKIKSEGNNIIFPYFKDKEIRLLKYLSIHRPDGKKQIRASTNSEPCLFGWQATNDTSRKIALVEGEIDAMSLYQYGIPFGVLSIPFGGGGGDKQKWVEYEYERLSIYEEIYLCLDNDAEGQVATQELIGRLGRHRCKVVILPFKDANECLINGISFEELIECFNRAINMDPQELKNAAIFTDAVIEEFNPENIENRGYYLPWGKTHGRIHLGIDELSIWTGINGHGKSQVLGHVILNCINQGAKVCIASLEIKPGKLLMRLTRQASGLRKPTDEYVRYILKSYQDNLWIFDVVGTAKTERILEVFKYARQKYGVDMFVIDSFMKCGLDEDDYNQQKRFIEQLCDFKNEYNCHVHLVVHPRKLDNERKSIPGKLDVKGSGAVTDLADNCFTVWRNKAKEEAKSANDGMEALKQQYDALLRCDKQRNGEWEGCITLWFDSESFQYLEDNQAKPKQLVNWSK